MFGPLRSVTDSTTAIPSQRDHGSTSVTTSAVCGHATVSDEDRLSMLKWHIDRSDRSRSSTAGRASIVLSAGAILSAGNAVLLSQVLGGTTGWLSSGAWLVAITIAVAGSALLVVSSLIKSAGVLLTTRGSRKVFEQLGDIPPGLIFNNADTVQRIRTFEDFRATTASFGPKEMADAAEVELWVCIHQHRHRYIQLRAAVRLLRYAALSFLVILVVVMIANLAYLI
jgi:hypothetical protein